MNKLKVFFAFAVLVLATAGVFAKVGKHAKPTASDAYIFKSSSWIRVVDALSTTATGNQAQVTGSAGSFNIYESNSTTTPLYLP